MTESIDSVAYDIRYRLTRLAFQEADVLVFTSERGADEILGPDFSLQRAISAGYLIELPQWPPPVDKPEFTGNAQVDAIKNGIDLPKYYVSPETSAVWKTVRSHFDFVVPMLTQFSGYAKMSDFSTPLSQIMEVQNRFNQAGFGYTSLLSESGSANNEAMSQVEDAVAMIDREGLSEVSAAISTGITAMIDMEWTGVAAKTFREQYGFRMPIYVGNHFALATVLRWSLEALQNVYVKVNTNAQRIGDKTRDALGSLLWGEPVDLAMIFTVTSAVLSVGGLFPPPASIICTVASAGASIASTALSAADSERATEDAEQDEQDRADGFSIGGDTLWEVLDSYSAAVEKLTTEIREVEDLIAANLRSLCDALNDGSATVELKILSESQTVSWREAYFEPRRPDLASVDENSVTDALGYPGL